MEFVFFFLKKKKIYQQICQLYDPQVYGITAVW